MKLLILTQVVDTEDSVLGFFHRWIEEFSKNVEHATVICLREGKHRLPANVKVLSLGKEDGVSRLKYAFNFYRYIIRERENYDAVFVHMNQVYVILGGFLWRMWGKRISLWYTHKMVGPSLRIAEKLVDVVFSASQTSFRLKSKKLVVTGHGIDTDVFVPKSKVSQARNLHILTAGRIAAVKGHTLVLNAVHRLRAEGIAAQLTIVGAPATGEDVQYQEELKEDIKRMELEDSVVLAGSVPHTEMVRYFQEADIFVNASGTESLDKTILEAMACGTTVVSSNDSAEALLEKVCPECIFKKQNLDSLVQALMTVREKELGEMLRKEVVEHHNLANLIRHLVQRLTYGG